jgi:hypothetical protein
MTSENSWERQRKKVGGGCIAYNLLLYRHLNEYEWLERGRLVEAFWRSAASAAATRVVLDRLLCAKLNGRKLLDSQTTGRFEISKGGPNQVSISTFMGCRCCQAQKKKKEEEYDIFIAAMSTRLSFDICRSISFGQAAMEGLFAPLFFLVRYYTIHRGLSIDLNFSVLYV